MHSIYKQFLSIYQLNRTLNWVQTWILYPSLLSIFYVIAAFFHLDQSSSRFLVQTCFIVQRIIFSLGHRHGIHWLVGTVARELYGNFCSGSREFRRQTNAPRQPVAHGGLLREQVGLPARHPVGLFRRALRPKSVPRQPENRYRFLAGSALKRWKT